MFSQEEGVIVYPAIGCVELIQFASSLTSDPVLSNALPRYAPRQFLDTAQSHKLRVDSGGDDAAAQG